MKNEGKFILPPPNFNKIRPETNQVRTPYLTPCGMNLLPRERQPPPMYGPRGPTIPARFLNIQRHNLKQQVINSKNDDKKNEQLVKERQHCEPCEMEFQSPEDLRIHRSQHEPCPAEGCRFKGHPSVMDKHVMLLHASGLFDKFKKLSTPEEIAAWRDERKKRYPTVANVQMKEKAKIQRQQRGERLEGNKKRFGNPKDRNRAKNHNFQKEKQHTKKFNEIKNKNHRANDKVANNCENKKKESNKTKNSQGNNPIKSSPNETTKDAMTKVVEEDIEKSLLKFKGTKSFKGYKHIKPKKIAQNNALSFLAAYFSDSESNLSESEESDNNSSLNHSQKTDIFLKNSKENTLNSKGFDINPDEHNISKLNSDCSHSLDVQIDPAQEQELTKLSTITTSDSNQKTILAKNPSTMKICEQLTLNHQSNSNLTNEIKNASIANNGEKFSNARSPTSNIENSFDSNNVRQMSISSSDERPEETQIANTSTSDIKDSTVGTTNSVVNVPSPKNQIDSIEKYASNAANDEKLSDTHISTTNIENSLESNTIRETNISSSDEGPEEAPIAHTSTCDIKDFTVATTNTVADVPSSKNQTDSIKKLENIRRKRRSGLNYRNAKLRKQNTMLEKLLETDIRHERNVLLQCVRFVCQNNFFDIGANKG